MTSLVKINKTELKTVLNSLLYLFFDGQPLAVESFWDLQLSVGIVVRSCGVLHELFLAAAK